jgi:HAD superfamily hydrolase (TIGR01549 family)
MDVDAHLARLAETTQLVLLDFDGAVCDLFTGPTADEVTSSLTIELDGLVAGELDDEVTGIDDPLDLLDCVAELYPHLSAVLDAALRQAETAAASTASLPASTVDLLTACASTGRRVALVSNTGAEAIEQFLRRHDLRRLVQHVEGRDADPRLMKPDPTPLLRAMHALGADPARTVMVGDSSSDLLAAKAAGVGSVSLADVSLTALTGLFRS